MRYALTLLLVVALPSCSAAQAGDGDETCADIAITEMPPVEFATPPTVNVEIAFPKRVIEVSIAGRTVDGVYTEGRCDVVVNDGNDGNPYATDYNACCPSGWHFLAVSGDEHAICEED